MAVSTIILPTKESMAAYGLNRTPNDIINTTTNPFIKTKQTEKSSLAGENFLNEVQLDFFKYSYPKVSTKVENGVAKSTYDYAHTVGDEIGKYRILLDESPSEVSHGHEWVTMDDNKLTEFYRDVGNAANAVQEVIQSGINLFTGKGEANTVYGKLDRASIYNKSEKPKCNINFTLITKDNFYFDIFAPLMQIVSHSYPSRKSELDNGSFGSMLTESTVEQADNLTSQINSAQRIYFYNNPCLANVTHLGGLYQFVNCYVEAITYKFGKSWYNGYFDPITNQTADIMGTRKFTAASRSFPTTCSVNIAFKSMENMFAGDWISMVNNGLSDYKKEKLGGK